MGVPSQSFAPHVPAAGSLDEAFPAVDPNFEPFGQYVLLQVRLAKQRVSKDSKILLVEDTRATIQANTQVAKVISYGPLAYKNRTTMQPWPEGNWAEAGDFVRVPKHTGDRWEIRHGEDVVTFVLLKDLELSGRIPRPLEAVAYV